MESFLEKLVKHICSKYPNDISKLCIVLPNRRAAIFLKTYFAKSINKTFWAPQIIAIEDFIALLSELQPVDASTALFELYDVVKKTNTANTESFDEFCKWGQILLNDFNEIDRYCVNASDLFLNLKNFKELETFSLNDSELTTFQKEYLDFFKSLAGYYSNFTNQLIEKKLAYQGLAYKIVEQNLNEKIKNQEWEKIIFAGFNALNKAEERIFSSLQSNNKAEIIWDVDSYYANDLNQEAGYFYRKFKNSPSFSKQWEKTTVIEENILTTGSKKINVIGVAKNVAQAKVAGNLINAFNLDGTHLQKTALVLADENLLFPVLHSLPSSVSDINITMGYPLKNTPVSGYIDLIFNLHESAQKIAGNRSNYSFYHTDIIKLLSHPYNSILFSDTKDFIEIKKIIEKIIARNIVFASAKTIEKLALESKFDKGETFELLFNQWENPSIALDAVYQLINVLKDGIVKKQGDSLDNKTNLELEYLFAFVKIINKIKTLSAEYDTAIESIKTLRSIFNQIVKATTLPFYGEPLLGLQIMGMLETRTLDFENVILLSCNEDVLPSAKTVNSFIPYEIKRFFGLPTYSEKDSIFSYHFYRLLQRAKNIYLIHNTETNEFGNGERSRYVTQLMYELPKKNVNVEIIGEVITFPLNMIQNENRISIDKNAEISKKIEEYASYGFSPSALNKYILCPLQFYFSTIAKIKEADEVEEVLGADTLGTVVHAVLEKLYSSYVNKNITEKDLLEMKKNVEVVTASTFEEHCDKNELYLGKNLLSLKVALKFVVNFIQSEINLLKKDKNKPLFIKHLEFELKTSLDIKGISVNLRGNADRIDLYNESTRIIDYKTGVVKDEELNINDIAELSFNVKLSKSFQLLMYAYMYQKSNTISQQNLLSGIVSFRNLSKGLLAVKYNKEANINSELLNQFEDVLINLIEKIIDKKTPFKQTNDIENCEYCSFKGICNR